jgi:cbb3-type cytochrome oxidase subunit 3
MIYAIATMFIILAILGVCAFAYLKKLEEQENDIAEQIIREHQKEIEELKKRRYYE